MTIFIKLLKFVKAVGFIIILFFSCYLLTSVVYYSRNHSNEEKNSLDIINDEKIEVVDTRMEEYIFLEIRIKDKVSEEYIVAYTLSYKDIYSKEIHLYVVDKEMVVNTGKEEIFILKK